MGRRKASRRPALSGSGSFSLDGYGLAGLPTFSYEGLPGDSIEQKAAAYVDALGTEPSARRGHVLWRCECVLEEFERERDGRPSFEEEILASL